MAEDIKKDFTSEKLSFADFAFLKQGHAISNKSGVVTVNNMIVPFRIERDIPSAFAHLKNRGPISIDRSAIPVFTSSLIYGLMLDNTSSLLAKKEAKGSIIEFRKEIAAVKKQCQKLIPKDILSSIKKTILPG